MRPEGDKGGEGEKKPQKEEGIVARDQTLLYEPFEMLTDSRRRLQIHLLQSLASEYRLAFNELFKTGLKEKKNVVAEIKEKLGKIRGILTELQVEEHVPDVDLHDAEEEDSVLKVKDIEISVEKWLSPEEKAQIVEAGAKEAE